MPAFPDTASYLLDIVVLLDLDMPKLVSVPDAELLQLPLLTRRYDIIGTVEFGLTRGILEYKTMKI